MDSVSKVTLHGGSRIKRTRGLRLALGHGLLLLALTCATAFADGLKPTPPPPSSAAADPTAAPLSSKSIYQLDVSFTTDEGRPFSLRELRGEPVVLTLFYTSCQAACPRMVEEMQRIEAALPEKAAQHTHFVLITFDPETDTVAALKAYRTARRLDARWILARGSTEDVRMLAMTLGIQYKQEGAMFAHSNLISILNREGELSFQHSGFSEKIDEFLSALQSAK